MIIKKLAYLAGVCALLFGCTNITESTGLDTRLSEVGATCETDLGAYQLPRRLVKVTVTAGANDGFGINIDEGNYVADDRQTFCLDFLSSRFAAERIGIERDGTLLKRVYTKTSDKSLEVAKKLVQAGADLAASQLGQLPGRDSIFKRGTDSKKILRFFEFDPMREADARKVNAALRPFGYCLYLKRFGDPFVPDWSGYLCRRDEGAYSSKLSQSYKPSGRRSGLKIIDDKPLPPSVQARGILYRPLVTHTMVIMRQDNPGIQSAPWYPAGSMKIQMPNASPPFLLNVKRALFVDANTDVKFNKGMVQNVEIHKPSELLALSEFTVQVVQIVHKIPAQALNIFSNRVDNTRALIDVNQKLIEQLETENNARGIANSPRETVLPDATNLALGRSFSQQNQPEVDRMSECLSDSSVQQQTNPAAYCRALIQNNL